MSYAWNDDLGSYCYSYSAQINENNMLYSCKTMLFPEDKDSHFQKTWMLNCLFSAIWGHRGKSELREGSRLKIDLKVSLHETEGRKKECSVIFNCVNQDILNLLG